jgi:phage gpG-like protein
VSNAVRDSDRGYRAMLQRLAGAKGARVVVGVLADGPKREHGGDEGPASLLEVAAIHEFGAPAGGIPQRSFIRGTVDDKAAEIRALQQAQAQRILRGDVDTPTALEQVGVKVAGWVQQRIAQGIEPPNAASTVERKGSSKPLVDTGQLRSSITSKVER